MSFGCVLGGRKYIVEVYIKVYVGFSFSGYLEQIFCEFFRQSIQEVDVEMGFFYSLWFSDDLKSMLNFLYQVSVFSRNKVSFFINF